MVWNCSFCFRNLEKGYSKREEQSGTCPTVIILSLGWVSVVGGQGTAGTARHSCLAGEKNTRTLQGCFVRIVSLLCNWQVAGKDQGGSGMRFAHLSGDTRHEQKLQFLLASHKPLPLTGSSRQFAAMGLSLCRWGCSCLLAQAIFLKNWSLLAVLESMRLGLM